MPFRAVGKRINNYGVQVIASGHEVLSGISPNLGGADEGPPPHELVLSGLVSCMIMTVQMYAARKNWPLESTEIAASIIAETTEQVTIKCEIKFSGQLDDEQRVRLKEIANRCPVHKFLTSHIVIEAEMAALSGSQESHRA